MADFVNDLTVIETSLATIGAVGIGNRYVRPAKWRAQVFGFRTMSLDIRQNSTVTTEVLSEIWGDAVSFGSSEWAARLRVEIAQNSDDLVPQRT